MLKRFNAKAPQGSQPTSPEDSDDDSTQGWENSSECSICTAQFSAHKRRHHCRLCLKSVCDLHSLKRWEVDSRFLRVCDDCERKRFAEEVEQEIAPVLAKRREKLELVKRELSCNSQGISVKEKEIIMVQQQWNDRLETAAEWEKKLEQKIALEAIESDGKMREIEALQSKLEAVTATEEDTRSKLAKFDVQKAVLQTELVELNQDQEDLYGALNRYTFMVNTRVRLPEAIKHLCEKCRKRIQVSNESQCEMQSLTTLVDHLKTDVCN